MKVVIFAGGIGSRITEESHLKPKPMIEIGNKPILWHIMKIYEAYGHHDFIICLGYRGEIIKDYFINYFKYSSDFTVQLNTGKLDIHSTDSNAFNVTLVDTGLNTKTAGRLKRVKDYIGNENFMLTYGDGVADINIHQLIDFHKQHNKICTLTSVKPAQSFGRLMFDNNGKVLHFREKSQDDAIWINGGFFVLKPEIFSYLPENSDDIMWEDLPLDNLTANGELYAYKHEGFWKCMDAMRDKIELDQLWDLNNAKWKIWK
jgi:glucose-1-phosphate cytidylyltransferase